MALNSIIVWIIVGGIAGTIADWLVSGVRLGCLGTVVVGIIGAFVGGWLLSVLHVSIGTGIASSSTRESWDAFSLTVAKNMASGR